MCRPMMFARYANYVPTIRKIMSFSILSGTTTANPTSIQRTKNAAVKIRLQITGTINEKVSVT